MNRAGEARPPCRLSTAEALPAPVSCGIWVASVNENKKQGTSHPHGCGSTRDAPTAGLDVRRTDPHAVVEDRQRAVDLAGSGGGRSSHHPPTPAGKRASSHARRGRSAARSSHCGPKTASQSPRTPGRGVPGSPATGLARRRGSPGCLHVCFLRIQRARGAPDRPH